MAKSKAVKWPVDRASIEVEREPSAPDDQSLEDEKKRKIGVAAQELPESVSRTDDTPDQHGIEIDNAIERPQDGQPGQPGAKVH